MDIYQWLDDTGKAAQDQTLHGRNPAPCRPRSAAKRRRSLSDNSLVGPLITSRAEANIHRTSTRTQQYAPSISSRSPSGSASTRSFSSLSTSSSSSSFSCSQVPEKTCVRRPRHKTRPDKYDVVSHKQSKAERKVRKHRKDGTRKGKKKPEKKKKQRRKRTHDTKGP